MAMMTYFALMRTARCKLTLFYSNRTFLIFYRNYYRHNGENDFRFEPRRTVCFTTNAFRFKSFDVLG